MSESKSYERARKRVQDLKGLYVHVAVYAIVIAGLFAINRMTSPDTWWVFWPAIGWGIAVAIHVVTFVLGGPFGPRWEERKIHELMERDEFGPDVRHAS